ncbi:MAG: DEAD/DEAH box helicase [Kouleothrix sp.]|nr:DEAD/DEAH box helicase [Kouleothrix sp.]
MAAGQPDLAHVHVPRELYVVRLPAPRRGVHGAARPPEAAPAKDLEIRARAGQPGPRAPDGGQLRADRLQPAGSQRQLGGRALHAGGAQLRARPAARQGGDRRGDRRRARAAGPAAALADQPPHLPQRDRSRDRRGEPGDRQPLRHVRLRLRPRDLVLRDDAVVPAGLPGLPRRRDQPAAAAHRGAARGRRGRGGAGPGQAGAEAHGAGSRRRAHPAAAQGQDARDHRRSALAADRRHARARKRARRPGRRADRVPRPDHPARGPGRLPGSAPAAADRAGRRPRRPGALGGGRRRAGDAAVPQRAGRRAAGRAALRLRRLRAALREAPARNEHAAQARHDRAGARQAPARARAGQLAGALVVRAQARPRAADLPAAQGHPPGRLPAAPGATPGRGRLTIYGEEALTTARVNRNKPTISFDVTSGIDWFDVRANVNYGELAVALKDIRQAVKKREKYIKLADGSIGALPEDWIDRYRHLLALGDEHGEDLRFSKHHITLLDQLLSDADRARTDEEFERRREKLRGFERIDPRPLPQGFIGELRPYQKFGYDWLHFLREYGFGGCLADDMGTGKTVAPPN